MERDCFIVNEQEAKKRLDLVLKERYPEFSRTYFQYLIDNGSVTANDKSVRKGQSQKEGTEIALFFLHSPELSVKPEAIDLDILYEDEYIIAINKTAGMVVHPAPGHPSGTLVNALLAHCQLAKGDEPLRPGIVHRLDKETSGVILCSKTPLAHRKLIEQFMERKIQKTYIAITYGTPKEQIVDAPIGRHQVKRKEMCVKEGGKAAVTHIKSLESSDRYALVEAKPITGRTHQIRVHLKHIGNPVVGDKIYGSKNNYDAERHLLHAKEIIFSHPISGEEITILTEPPKDFLPFF